MAAVKSNEVPKVIVFGGRNEANFEELLQCEKWDDQKLQWKPSSTKLIHGTNHIGFWAPNNYIN